MSFECLKKTICVFDQHITEDIFSDEVNRKRFIQIYQENIVNAQVDDCLGVKIKIIL